MKSALIKLVLALNLARFLSAQPVEDFVLYGPMDFHELAMGSFMKQRREDPNVTMDYDGEFMKKAKDHAVKRMMIKSDEEMDLRGKEGVVEGLLLEGGETLKLPSPKDQGEILTTAVTAVSSGTGSYAVMLPEEANALSMVFNEEIATGAISKAGALPLGDSPDDTKWLKFAEDKLKRDNRLDHQSLLWELGSEIAETTFKAQGGVNVTKEEELLIDMKAWFEKGGGKLRFVEPAIGSKENHFLLKTTESVNPEEVVVSVPMKLIMSRQTARNVLIHNRGKYLGEELTKTFEKDEAWGLAIFLLHEYYKDVTKVGSKWGPFIRTLRMRLLSTEALHNLRGTTAANLVKKWLKGADSFMWWTTGVDGPCSPTTGICKTKPNEKFGDNRFNNHHLRWAYWVVKQNSVKIKHVATGLEFLALVPFYNMFEKTIGNGSKGGGVSFELDGTVALRAGPATEEGGAVKLTPGNFSDPEFFLRYMHLPDDHNEHNLVKLSLPGAIPKGSKFHYCMKGTWKEQNKDECKGAFRSESMFWKSKVLGEWRQAMNLPPRMQELRMWANRLHLYGTEEEMKLMSAANQMIAGLPIPVDQMPAEEQLMLMGVAKSGNEAALMVAGGAERPPPQLYTAPDPEEDPEAQRAMENLATLALQAKRVMNAGNVALNATQAVLNHTRDFFLHGVLPMAGLDELDEFLLKKIGMLAHCGFENDMKIAYNNITDELMCAMRVHLMNESEVNVFCPAEARPWEENCHNVEFANFTAITPDNERNVIGALKASLQGMLHGYPTTVEEDRELLLDNRAGVGAQLGQVMQGVVKMRLREKELLLSALHFLDLHEEAINNGTVVFQLEEKARQRAEADERERAHQEFLAEIKAKAAIREPLGTVEVDLGPDVPKANLTIEEGQDIRDVVIRFCREHGVTDASNVPILEKALRGRVASPRPPSLFMGVVIPTGDRKILSIPEGTNVTVETGVFCAKWGIRESDQCDKLLERVNARLNVSFVRRILVVVPIDAPDSRKLQLVVREGEQHDLLQFVADFFELYHMPTASLEMVANEVHRRLPAVALQIPVGLSSKRQVSIRFSLGDNITAVVEAFTNFYEIDSNTKLQIVRHARNGMSPGSFLV